LAPIAEAFVCGETIDDAAIFSEIAPAFVKKDGRRTDTVVLACTHYPFLAEHFRRLGPWPVAWIDPAPAIARRVAAVAVEGKCKSSAAHGRAMLTSGKTWPAALDRVLRGLLLDAKPSV
jgi:glutamate racemase